MNPGAKVIKKRIRGERRGEINNTFLSSAKLAEDWKEDNPALERKTIFKKKSYIFKKVLRCVRFHNA